MRSFTFPAHCSYHERSVTDSECVDCFSGGPMKAAYRTRTHCCGTHIIDTTIIPVEEIEAWDSNEEMPAYVPVEIVEAWHEQETAKIHLLHHVETTQAIIAHQHDLFAVLNFIASYKTKATKFKHELAKMVNQMAGEVIQPMKDHVDQMVVHAETIESHKKPEEQAA